jgi:hypothetical protein
MSPLARVLLVFFGCIGVFLIVVATRPPTFHLQRETQINTLPQYSYAQVEDFHNWKAWSPWAKLDPEQKITFAGTPGTVGSSYAWVGNDKVGEGRMTISDSVVPSKIAIKLEFIKPFPSSSVVTFSFVPQGSGTHVTWAMDGERNFMAKAVSLVVDMDKMVGPDFEKGLADLKAVSEKAAAFPGEAATQPAAQ